MLQLRGHRKRVCSLAYSTDGRLLASASKEGKIIVWDLAAGQPRVSVPVERDVFFVGFTRAGQLLTARQWGGLAFVDAVAGTVRDFNPPWPTGYSRFAVAVAAHEERVALAQEVSGGAVIHLGDPKTGWEPEPYSRD